jgi:tetratricopeptide (TPR) repeat protein
MSQSDTNREGLLDRVKAQSKKPRRRLGKVLLALFVGILLVAIIGFFTLPGSGLGLKLGLTKKTDYQRMMEFVAQGRKAYQKRDYDRALRFFQEAEKVLGTVEEPYRMQALCVLRREPPDFQTARSLLEKAIRVEPRLDKARVQLALLSLTTNQPKRVLALADEIAGSTRRMPLEMLAYAQRAADLLQEDELALQYGEARVKSDGESPEPCHTLARAYLKRFGFGRAAADLERADDLLQSALRRGQARRDRGDESPGLLRLLALVQADMASVAVEKNLDSEVVKGHRNEALDLIRRAIEKSREGGETPVHWVAVEAGILKDQGFLDDALARLATERKDNPSLEAFLADIRLRLAWARRAPEAQRLVLLRGAEEVLAEGSEAFPEAVSAFRLAQVRLKEALGQAEEAERILLEAAQKAEEEGQDSGLWRLALGEQRLRSGETKEAEKHYLRVLETDPGNRAALRALLNLAGQDFLRRRDEEAEIARGTLDSRLAKARAHLTDDPVILYWEGMIQLREGRFSKAKDDFESVLSAEPAFLPAHLARGYALQALGDLPGAIAAFRTFMVEEAKRRNALQLEGPPSAQAQLSLLSAYLAAGKLKEAVLLGRRATADHPESRQLLFLYGRALLRDGDGARARDLFESLLELQPDWGPALIGLGQSLWLLNRRLSAKRAFDQAVLTDDHPRTRRLLGEFYIRQGEHDLALAEYQRIVERFDRDPEAYLALGTHLESRGELEKARSVYRRGLDLDPDHVGLWAELGDSYLTVPAVDATDLALARQCGNEILQRDPRSLFGRLLLAGTLYRQRDLKAAEALLEELLGDYPDSPGARRLLARCVLEQPNPDLAVVRRHLGRIIQYRADPRARALLSRVAILEGLESARSGGKEALQRANEKFLEAVRQDEDDPWARLMLADSFLRLAETESDPAKIDLALDEAREIIRRQPESAAGYLMRGSITSYRAARAGDEKQAARALADLQLATEKAPEYSGAYLALAAHHGRHGEFSQAFQAYARALELVPAHLGALRGAAVSLGAQGKWEQAESLVRASNDAHGDRGGYGPYLLATILEGAGKTEQALEAYRATLKLSPRWESAASRLLHLLRKSERQEELATLVRQLVTALPESPRYQVELGQVLLAEGKPSEAREVFETAIQAATALETRFAPAYVGLVRAYQTEGKADAAVARIEELAKADAGNALLWFLLGSLEESRGRSATAKGHYESALRLQPNLHAAANNLAWIHAWHDAGVEQTEEQRNRTLERALVLAEQARQGMRQSAQVMDTLAWVHISLGRYEQALGLLENAEEALRDDVMYQFHRARALEGLGRIEEARGWLDRADQGIASYPLADERLRRELRETRRRIQ